MTQHGVWGRKFLEEADLRLLDKWNPSPYFMVDANYVAKDEVFRSSMKTFWNDTVLGWMFLPTFWNGGVLVVVFFHGSRLYFVWVWPRWRRSWIRNTMGISWRPGDICWTKMGAIEWIGLSSNLLVKSYAIMVTGLEMNRQLQIVN